MADVRDITHAIYAINSSAVFHIGAENSADVLDSCTIEWLEGTTPISKADIQTKINELQVEYDAKEYARKRETAYPQLKEFAEAYTEKEIGGDDTKWNEYVTKYNKVRTDNPKE